jgi:L-cysteine:1D-myo-inositol 2-amino-2-deoxy-alpha-D-glucopyranoside ligase
MDSWRAATVPSLPGRGPEPYLVNTATGELTRAAAGQAASLYACGITPYDATHLGHAATYLAWDLLVRAWRDAGHDVTYVQNVTDVDDPLLERADRDGEDWRALAHREIARYRADMEALRILPPTHLVGAVEALPLIARLNRMLADRGALYELERDVYFSRAADPAFGSVSHLGPAQMVALAAERGGDPARPGKKDPVDPVVWLAARSARGGGAAAEPAPGAGGNEPSWESAFGPGRPGWHVECAAIATSYLGPVFDVQAGGSDLIFPHHEFSASHARVALGDGTPGSQAFARSYAHSGMVRLDGEKMSKSLGNLVFVSRLLADGADPMAVRLAIMSHHYSPDWDWTAAGLAAAQERLGRWRAAVTRALASAGPAGPACSAADAGSGAAVPTAESVLAAVRERIADDLDAPGALAAVDRWASAVLAAPVLPAGLAEPAALVRDTVDALLGVAL